MFLLEMVIVIRVQTLKLRIHEMLRKFREKALTEKYK